MGGVGLTDPPAIERSARNPLLAAGPVHFAGGPPHATPAR